MLLSNECACGGITQFTWKQQHSNFWLAGRCPLTLYNSRQLWTQQRASLRIRPLIIAGQVISQREKYKVWRESVWTGWNVCVSRWMRETWEPWCCVRQQFLNQRIMCNYVCELIWNTIVVNTIDFGLYLSHHLLINFLLSLSLFRNLFNNGFQEIESHAFNGTKTDKL